jgi:hypothetical protein
MTRRPVLVDQEEASLPEVEVRAGLVVQGSYW